MLAEKLAVKLGDEHYLTLSAYHNLAVCMRMQRNMPEYERLLRIVLEKNIAFYGEGDPDTFLYSLKLSEALSEMGRHTEALAVVEKKYKALAKACGSSHSRTLSYGRRIARCYEALGRHKEAISFLTNSINYASKSGDKLTKGLLKSVLSLGDVFRYTDRFAEAITCYEECLKSTDEIDCLSQKALIIVRKLGCCYEDLERYDEALALYQRTLDQTNSIYRDDHRSTREVLIQMDELRDFLDARDEMTCKKYCELGRIESSGLKEMLRKDEPMSMDDVLRNSNATENEEEWMREMFDFDLLRQAHLPQ
jgi:tetratricopeptide (TPR) repeat protein